MQYQVLAQKYRPQTFDDVVGQEAVTRTLKNSISKDRIANAYIFCGPRGVGKTSIARLVAKTLNCPKPVGSGPCNKCVSCAEITKGSSLDVLEIDGASNRGIDEVRTLRENVKFSPSSGKYKIYIIDEVHMLTTEAFNALLKTLEEPPAHVKFIFATTEPHRVLPTIMSRCQRFDFKRLSPKLISEYVGSVAEKEKINIEQPALLLIAKSADGSLRDALVILDQMVSFSSSKITVADVHELLGMVHSERISALSDAIIGGDVSRVAGMLDELINGGKDPVFVAGSLLGHFRDLMVLKTAGGPTTDMVFSGEELEEMKGRAGRLTLEEILYILQNISNCMGMMKGTSLTRVPLEVTLVRMAKRGDILAIPEIIRMIENAAPDGGTASFLSERAAEPLKGIKAGAGERSGELPEKQAADHKESDRVTAAGDDPVKGGDISSASYTEQWTAVLNSVKVKKMSVYSFLNFGKLLEFSPEKVIIGFKKDQVFNKEVLEEPDNMKIVEDALAEVVGGKPAVELKVLDFLGGSPEEAALAQKKKMKAREAMNPAIEKAMQIFNGRIIRDSMGG